MSAPALKRDHFTISRAAEYFTAGELQAQTGQPTDGFWHVALKELVDNALDAAESAGQPPAIEIDYRREHGRLALAVADNGPGIPEAVIASILDFNSRTSDKAAYRAPTRGAQGNALKTLVGIPAALGAERAKLAIETQGARHELSAWITPAGEVQTARTVAASERTTGARISLDIPGDDDTDWHPERFVVGYALFNPHATLQIRGIETAIQHAESDQAKTLDLSFPAVASERWRKFGPADKTAAHWYAPDEFERLVHLKAAKSPEQSIRAFAAEFRGQSRRLPEIAAAVEVSTMGELIEHPEAIATLHRALMDAPAPKPDILGRIGADHLRAILDRYSIKPERYWYKHLVADIGGLPFVVEVAIAETEQPGANHHGLNFSVPFGDPLAGTWLGKDHGINGELSANGVFNGERYGRRINTATAVHLVMPRLPSLDRGKSRLSLSQAQRAAVAETITKAARVLNKEFEQHLKQRQRTARAMDRWHKATDTRLTKKEAVESLLLETYLRATENEALFIANRDLYYAIRPGYNTMDVRESKTGAALDSGYFSQTIIPAYRATVHPLPNIDYKARGVLFDPHTGEEQPIGDKEMRDWEFPRWQWNKLLFIEKEGIWETLKQTGGIEFAKRYDMAIVCSEGFSTTAVRKLFARAQAEEGCQLFVWHDADPAGYGIARTLAEETARMPDHRIKVFDLGLKLEHAIEAGYQSETFTRKNALPSTLALTEFEREHFTGKQQEVGYGKSEWRDCIRVEINAIPVRERVPYLEARLAEIPDLLPKVQPPADILNKRALALADELLTDQVREEIERQLDLDSITAAARSALGTIDIAAPALERYTARRLVQHPAQSWRDVARSAAIKRTRNRVEPEAVTAVVRSAIARQLKQEAA